MLIYSRFNIGNYFWHGHMCLTTPLWIEWIKWPYLCFPNHLQKINFAPQLNIEIQLTYCFASLRACLTHTHLEWLNRFITCMDAKPHAKKPDTIAQLILNVKLTHYLAWISNHVQKLNFKHNSRNGFFQDILEEY